MKIPAPMNMPTNHSHWCSNNRKLQSLYARKPHQTMTLSSMFSVQIYRPNMLMPMNRKSTRHLQLIGVAEGLLESPSMLYYLLIITNPIWLSIGRHRWMCLDWLFGIWEQRSLLWLWPPSIAQMQSMHSHKGSPSMRFGSLKFLSEKYEKSSPFGRWPEQY